MPKKINPREMMELAVEVMRKSIAEPRDDGKPSPMVGAVLVRPGGSVVTACRGELREGNHAEFTLIERKCVNENLEGCVLFATLEPCLDRTHPKRGCAKHIVGARIREVYVGIEDDNPAVAGRGIEYLRRNKVTVHMFDHDLQEVILSENKAFFEWARKQAEKPEEEEAIKLSHYEDAVPAVDQQDFSIDALEFYQKEAKIGPAVGSDDFKHLLQQQLVLVEDKGKIVPSGFGLILFGKNPANAIPQARLLARADLPDGKSTRREFAGPLVLVPAALETWLKQVIPSVVDRSEMKRTEKVELPFEMIREAVVNALIHRDYGMEGEKCQLVITPETITIRSPGGPTPPITLDQLRSFTAPMKSRNPLLHHVFARMNLAEEQGYGLTSLKRHAETLGLPLPAYSMEGNTLVLTIYRNKRAATTTLGRDVLVQLSKPELEGWEWLSTKDQVSSNDYAKGLGIPNRTALNHLKRFTSLGLLEKTGAGPKTAYKHLRR